jgi:hypothetical protein
VAKTKTQADWGHESRWLIDSHLLNSGSREWHVRYAEGCGDPENAITLWSFAEAHAAYLDAVTCPQRTPFVAYTTPTCNRARGHDGPHRFWSKDGRTPLEQMPK